MIRTVLLPIFLEKVKISLRKHGEPVLAAFSVMDKITHLFLCDAVNSCNNTKLK